MSQTVRLLRPPSVASGVIGAARQPPKEGSKTTNSSVFEGFIACGKEEFDPCSPRFGLVFLNRVGGGGGLSNSERR